MTPRYLIIQLAHIEILKETYEERKFALEFESILIKDNTLDAPSNAIELICENYPGDACALSQRSLVFLEHVRVPAIDIWNLFSVNTSNDDAFRQLLYWRVVPATDKSIYEGDTVSDWHRIVARDATLIDWMDQE